MAYFILLTNRIIFPKDYMQAGLRKYRKDDWSIKLYHDTRPHENFKNISLEAVKFINDLVRFDYKERPTAFEVMDHPYFSLDLSSGNHVTIGDIAKGPKIKPGMFPCLKKAYPDFLLVSTKDDNFQEFYDQYIDFDLDKYREEQLL